MPIVISHHTALTSLDTSRNHRYFDTGRETCADDESCFISFKIINSNFLDKMFFSSLSVQLNNQTPLVEDNVLAPAQE